MYKESYMATADGTQTVDSSGFTHLVFPNLIKDSEGNFELGIATIPPSKPTTPNPPNELLYYIEYTVVLDPGVVAFAPPDTMYMRIEIDSSGPSLIYPDTQLGGQYSGSFEVKMANIVPVEYDWPIIRYIRPAITITGPATRTISADSTLLVIAL
jgi:hypothetical protein